MKKWKTEDTVIIIAVIVIAFLTFLAGYKSAKEKYTGEYSNYTVKQNDTLWNIAKRIDTDEQIEEVIHKIKKDNNMSESNLKIGQALKIREDW